ncbi:MAG: hypothetical protein ACYTFW_16125 [Planctomycetota bacterium]|jgi:hypothetical protein
MEVSQENAQDSLNQIQTVFARTRKSIASSPAGSTLILWGLLWLVTFTVVHFYLAYAFYIFMAMNAVGVPGTFIIWWIFHTRAPVRNSSGQSIVRRIFWLWAVLLIYIFIWLDLLAPYSGMQLNAFLCTAAMFAYIVMGLWFGSNFMILLALGVTAATLVGYHVLTPYYCLWMALVGGGAFTGTGLYIRICWR